MAFLFGFGLGVAASLAYIFFGPWGWFGPSLPWAQIVFFPGVLAGHTAYSIVGPLLSDFDLSLGISYAIGVAAMGCTVGALFSAGSLFLRLFIGSDVGPDGVP